MLDRHAELLAMLRTLKLPAMASAFPDLALRAAKQGLTHEAFLYDLVQCECVQRERAGRQELPEEPQRPPDEEGEEPYQPLARRGCAGRRVVLHRGGHRERTGTGQREQDRDDHGRAWARSRDLTSTC